MKLNQKFAASGEWVERSSEMGVSNTIKEICEWGPTYQSASPVLLQLERKLRVFSTASIVCGDTDTGEIEQRENPIRAADERRTRGDVAIV